MFEFREGWEGGGGSEKSRKISIESQNHQRREGIKKKATQFGFLVTFLRNIFLGKQIFFFYALRVSPPSLPLLSNFLLSFNDVFLWENLFGQHRIHGKGFSFVKESPSPFFEIHICTAINVIDSDTNPSPFPPKTRFSSSWLSCLSGVTPIFMFISCFIVLMETVLYAFYVKFLIVTCSVFFFFFG